CSGAWFGSGAGITPPVKMIPHFKWKIIFPARCSFKKAATRSGLGENKRSTASGRPQYRTPGSIHRAHGGPLCDGAPEVAMVTCSAYFGDRSFQMKVRKCP